MTGSQVWVTFPLFNTIRSASDVPTRGCVPSLLGFLGQQLTVKLIRFRVLFLTLKRGIMKDTDSRIFLIWDVLISITFHFLCFPVCVFVLFLFTFSTYLVHSTFITQTWHHSKSLPLKICSIGQLNVHVSNCGNYEAKWENSTINVFSCNIHPTIRFQYPRLPELRVVGICWSPTQL